MEEWKAIKGWEGRYEISNHGYVQSIATRYGNPKLPRVLKRRHMPNGYQQAVLGHSTYHYIHRLVAQTFIPNPNNLPFVNHIDGNRANNHVSNLEWCDQKHNLAHAVRIGSMSCQKGEGNHNSKLTDAVVRQIRAMHVPYKRTVSYPKLAQLFGVSLTAVRNAIKGKTWSHLT